MSLELEVLDQLQGGDLPLGVLAALFPDEAHARRGILAMVLAGDVNLLDVEGVALSAWQLRELQRRPSSWRTDTQYHLSLTEAGARRVG